MDIKGHEWEASYGLRKRTDIVTVILWRAFKLPYWLLTGGTCWRQLLDCGGASTARPRLGRQCRWVGAWKSAVAAPLCRRSQGRLEPAKPFLNKCHRELNADAEIRRGRDTVRRSATFRSLQREPRPERGTFHPAWLGGCRSGVNSALLRPCQNCFSVFNSPAPVAVT